MCCLLHVDFRFSWWSLKSLIVGKKKGIMYRTQMKMQLQKQHAEMLARKEEEEERKRRENQRIPQQSRSVDVPISKSMSNSDVPNDVLKVCMFVCVCVCVCVMCVYNSMNNNVM